MVQKLERRGIKLHSDGRSSDAAEPLSPSDGVLYCRAGVTVLGLEHGHCPDLNAL
jgi:hypothetical protein